MDYVKYIRNMVGHNKIIMAAGGVLLVNEEGSILLQQRSDNELWGLIGGIMELDETFHETAIREAKEETGCDVELDYLLGIYHNKDMHWPSGDDAHVICAIYKAHIIKGSPRCDLESLNLKWFRVEDMPELFAPDHRQAVLDYIHGIKNHVQ